MGAHFERGRLLLEQERHDLAIREFELELAEDPDRAHVHAMLALSRRALKDFRRAEEHARRAIELAPDTAFVHYVLAQVALGTERFADALKSLDEATRLEPDDADYHALRAAVLLRREQRKEALAVAEKALELDAENSLAQNVRASALVTLGRAGEARAGLNDALERRPEDAYTHANQGWTLLHAGDHRRAIEHFGEALRLDPTDGWAKDGMLEALKARYVVYRWMLAFYLWQSRMTSQMRWGLVLGAYVGVKLLNLASKRQPALAPFVAPIVVAYAMFVFLTWTADALFDLAIFCHRAARHLLTPAKRATSIVIFGLLGIAASFGVAALVLRSPALGFGAAGLTLALLPTSIAGSRRGGWPRWTMSLYAGAAIAAVIGFALASALTGDPSYAQVALIVAVIATAAATWVGSLLPRAEGHPDG